MARSHSEDVLHRAGLPGRLRARATRRPRPLEKDDPGRRLLCRGRSPGIGSFGRCVREMREPAPVDVHRRDVAMAFLVLPIEALEDDLGAIGRPHGEEGEGEPVGWVRQLPESAPVRTHDVHLRVRAETRAEGDQLAGRRPARGECTETRAEHPAETGAVDVDDVQDSLERRAARRVTGEGHLCPVG